MANIERTQILKRLSEIYQVKLYTKNPTPELPNVINMGSVDYYDMMPYVFKCSDINLNITLRSIKTGIPLRAMDIMGAGGFLMSNYQADFYRHFVPGEDLVLYESHDDLMDKCNYYLVHDAERRQIAANGYGTVSYTHLFAKSGMSSDFKPIGYPEPSHFSWCSKMADLTRSSISASFTI